MVAGDLREGLNRLSLVFLLAGFCLPLFIGLGRTELENDEAIYSYATESILATGEWASPRSSPSPDAVFLEKPPLKFWIVAAGIRVGLLPLDEFGLRFWDALFGATAFVYVFLIGRRLSGPVCGLVAVLVLFAHGPLLFVHGLRSNNMEAALFLAYCGAVYHYLAWVAALRTRHVAAIAAFFYLGFMTKFVAAAFVPLILCACVVILPPHRRLVRHKWRTWGMAGCIVLGAILPWFLYQASVNGAALWEIMVGDHVYTRFTGYADPLHVQPWHFYITDAWRHFTIAGSAWWVLFGLVLLGLHTVRQRRPEGIVVLLWFALPVALISLGTSKLYHYLYPFLPPLALAAGYGVAWLVRQLADLLAPFVDRVIPAPTGWRRRLLVPMAVGALGVALVTAIAPVHMQSEGRTIFSNRSVLRPVAAAALFAWGGGHVTLASGIAGALAAGAVMPTPFPAYRANLRQLGEVRAPLRQLGACLREVDARRRATGADVGEPYAPVSGEAFLHPYFYYLRGSDWTTSDVKDDVLYSALFEPGRERPVVIDPIRYDAFLQRVRPPDTMPSDIRLPGVLVLLPGDYSACRLAHITRPR